MVSFKRISTSSCASDRLPCLRAFGAVDTESRETREPEHVRRPEIPQSFVDGLHCCRDRLGTGRKQEEEETNATAGNDQALQAAQLVQPVITAHTGLVGNDTTTEEKGTHKLKLSRLRQHSHEKVRIVES